MKAKTIKMVLRKKVNEWLSSIDDEALQTFLKDQIIVTGGAIASMLLREKVNDFDIYFRSHEAALRVAEHYVKEFKLMPPPRFKGGVEIPIHVEDKDGRVKVVVQSAGIASETDPDDYQYFEGLDDAQNIATAEYVEQAMGGAKREEEDGEPIPYRPVFLSANAITLSDKVQVVFRFYGEPDEIHENYDFTHCTCYWSSWDNKLILRPDAMESLLARELRYVGSKYPLCSIIRTRKFIARNWTINAGQYLKMVMQLNALDLTDLAVLEDQLTGVDTAYFIEVINKLKAKDPTKVNQAYLMEIIDRIF